MWGAPFVALAITGLAIQGGNARPSEELIRPPQAQVGGRHLAQNPPGPAQAGCTAAGLSCCYSPTWWLDKQPSPSAKCTDGTYDSSVTPEDLLQACQDGQIGPIPLAGKSGIIIYAADVDCTYYENLGDYTSPFPCSSNTFQGQTITVYDPANLVGNNDEVVWADAAVANNEPTGVETCNTPGASYTLTATYSKSSSWNIGIQLGAKFLSDYEAKLTAGYSQTYTVGQNAGVTVTTTEGEHATVTAGTLVHHTIGWWDVQLHDGAYGQYENCKRYRVDNVAADLIMPKTDPHFPTDYGTEVKPCGYPLLNGKLT